MAFSYFFSSSPCYLRLAEYSPQTYYWSYHSSAGKLPLIPHYLLTKPEPGIQRLQNLYPLYPSKTILSYSSSQTFKLSTSASSHASPPPPERPLWPSLTRKILPTLQTLTPLGSLPAAGGTRAYMVSPNFKCHRSLNLPRMFNLFCLVRWLLQRCWFCLHS